MVKTDPASLLSLFVAARYTYKQRKVRWNCTATSRPTEGSSRCLCTAKGPGHSERDVRGPREPDPCVGHRLRDRYGFCRVDHRMEVVQRPHAVPVPARCAGRPAGCLRTGLRGRAMTGAALVLSVVDTCTGEMHLVAVEIAALHRRSGRYPALCGTLVTAASLTTAPARQCPNCVKQAHRRGEGGSLR